MKLSIIMLLLQLNGEFKSATVGSVDIDEKEAQWCLNADTMARVKSLSIYKGIGWTKYNNNSINMFWTDW